MKKSLHGSPSSFKFFGNCSLDETLWKVMKGNGWLNTFPLIFSVKFKIRALVFLSFCKIWSLLLLTRSSGKTLILSSGLRSVAIMKLMWSFFSQQKANLTTQNIVSNTLIINSTFCAIDVFSVLTLSYQGKGHKRTNNGNAFKIL